MTDVLDTLRGATALVRRVTLCTDGALQAEYDRLVSTMSDAALRDQDSLAAEHTTAVVDQMEAVREKMKLAEVIFSFGALPWMRRLILQGEHPVREGNVADRASGHNVETYIPALIRESCVSVQGIDGVAVTDIPADVWDALLGKLNFQQIDVLFGAAQNANDAATAVPLSARPLVASQVLAPTSKLRARGTSRRDASLAGNRPIRRKSSTTKTAESADTSQAATDPNGTTTPAT